MRAVTQELWSQCTFTDLGQCYVASIRQWCNHQTGSVAQIFVAVHKFSVANVSKTVSLFFAPPEIHTKLFKSHYLRHAKIRYLWRSWDCHMKAAPVSTLDWISFATTSRECTSMVQIVMIFCLSSFESSPMRSEIKVLSCKICTHNEWNIIKFQLCLTLYLWNFLQTEERNYFNFSSATFLESQVCDDKNRGKSCFGNMLISWSDFWI